MAKEKAENRINIYIEGGSLDVDELILSLFKNKVIALKDVDHPTPRQWRDFIKKIVDNDKLSLDEEITVTPKVVHIYSEYYSNFAGKVYRESVYLPYDTTKKKDLEKFILFLKQKNIQLIGHTVAKGIFDIENWSPGRIFMLTAMPAAPIIIAIASIMVGVWPVGVFFAFVAAFVVVFGAIMLYQDSKRASSYSITDACEQISHQRMNDLGLGATHRTTLEAEAANRTTDPDATSTTALEAATAEEKTVPDPTIKGTALEAATAEEKTVPDPTIKGTALEAATAEEITVPDPTIKGTALEAETAEEITEPDASKEPGLKI